MACTANQLLLVGLLGVSAVAQNRRVECAEPKNTYKLGLPEVQARIDAGSDDFFLYKGNYLLHGPTSDTLMLDRVEWICF